MIVEELITRLVLKDESKAGLKQAEANRQRKHKPLTRKSSALQRA